MVPRQACRISVTFLDRDGTEYKVKAAVGENMLSVAHREEIDLEGACEGSLACSTCHVIIKDEDMFSKLPEADDDENDMLDLAFGLTETCGTRALVAQKVHVLHIRSLICGIS